MKTYIIVVLLFLCFTFIHCSNGSNSIKRETSEVTLTIEKLRTAPDSALTKIHIENPDRDYQIKRGDKIKDSIIIRNKGNKPLKIESIKSKCDCTTINFDNKKLLSPNDVIVVHYSIVTDDMQIGNNHRTISIVGNFFPYFKNISITLFVSK